MLKKQVVPKRGEIYLVNFDPTVGSEVKKTRPALVLQNNVANRYSPVVIVAALSSHVAQKIYPTEVLIEHPEGGINNRSAILLNQIRTIDKQRLVKKLGMLNSNTMDCVNRALQISLGLVEI